MDKDLDIGYYYVGKTSNKGTRKFFTVQDGDVFHVYERPPSILYEDLRTAIHMAFVAPFDWGEGEERRVSGAYPTFSIVGGTVTELTLKHLKPNN